MVIDNLLDENKFNPKFLSSSEIDEARKKWLGKVLDEVEL